VREIWQKKRRITKWFLKILTQRKTNVLSFEYHVFKFLCDVYIKLVEWFLSKAEHILNILTYNPLYLTIIDTHVHFGLSKDQTKSFDFFFKRSNMLSKVKKYNQVWGTMKENSNPLDIII
jgi:hypothetical protein